MFIKLPKQHFLMIEEMKKASKVWIEVKEVTDSLVKPGANVLEITEKIEGKIKEKAECAFPLNISFNNEAAHYSPNLIDKREVSKEDVIKIDVGVHVDGWAVDAAYTIDLSGKHNKQMQTNKDALDKAVKYIKKEGTNSVFDEIGTIIQEEIESKGFKPILNLTGHSIEQYNLHSGKAVCNYKNGNKNTLGTGIYAIEPFATTGSGKVHNGNFCSIYFYLGGNIRDTNARKLIEEIKQYNGLPFSERWIGKSMSAFNKKFAISQLIKNNIFKPAQVLKDIDNSIVTQFEKTILIEEDNVHVFPNLEF
jgi:methionyl aminopeptidase